MSSNRLPGKVLQEIDGIPLLGLCIERCQKAGVGTVVVATSDERDDDAIVSISEKFGACVLRGPLDNVLERYRLLANAFDARYVVRISGDSPSIDPELIRTAVSLCNHDRIEIVSNVAKRTFPKGQSVEVMTREVLGRLTDIVHESFDLEHVTSYVYQNPEQFRLLNFESAGDFGHIQLAVDSHQDLECMRRLFEASSNSLSGWRDLVELRKLICG